MKKLLHLLLLFLFTSTSLYSQFWNKKSTGFTAASRGVLDISFVDANNVWFQAYNGAAGGAPILEFARSSDGGNTWVNGTINVLYTGALATNTISSFKAVSATTCYVGTADYGLWKTTDSGATWTFKTAGLFTGPDSFFNFGAFFSENVGIVGGDPDGGYMEIHRTIDGGNTWTRIPSSSIPAIQTGEYFFTNSYTQLGNALYFFTNKARTYRTLDAGLTWDVFDNPFTAEAMTPGGKLCLKTATEGIYYDPNYSYWKTTDGGATYTSIAASGTLRISEISFIPGTLNTYVSIGTDLDFDARGTSISCDGGENWDDINQFGDIQNVDGTAAISFFNETTGLASGFNTNSSVGGIFKYNNLVPMGSANSACVNLANAQFKTSKLFNISPNPATSNLSINGINISQVQITDMLGKIIFSNNYSSIGNLDINIGSFNSGIYLVKVTNNEGISNTEKVIKQ